MSGPPWTPLCSATARYLHALLSVVCFCGCIFAVFLEGPAPCAGLHLGLSLRGSSSSAAATELSRPLWDVCLHPVQRWMCAVRDWGCPHSVPPPAIVSLWGLGGSGILPWHDKVSWVFFICPCEYCMFQGKSCLPSLAVSLPWNICLRLCNALHGADGVAAVSTPCAASKSAELLSVCSHPRRIQGVFSEFSVRRRLQVWVLVHGGLHFRLPST